MAFVGQMFCQQMAAMITPVFKVGEQLNYKLKYAGFFTAAEADSAGRSQRQVVRRPPGIPHRR